MHGFGFNFGALDLLAYLVIGVGALAVVVPVGLLLIRRLNETWLDAEWREACRDQQQNSIESILVRKGNPIVTSFWWGLLIEFSSTMAGAGFGAMVYLPGPLDGWFIFSIMLFGGAGAILGLFVTLAVLFARLGD